MPGPSNFDYETFFKNRFGTTPPAPPAPGEDTAKKYLEGLKERFGKNWPGKDKSSEEEAKSMRLNIAPAARVATPVTAVPTSSPAYAKGGMVKKYGDGGMVRGCGKAVKGRGKVKVY